MPIHSNTYLMHGTCGISRFHKKEHQSSIGERWNFSCFPACLDTRDIFKGDKLQSQAFRRIKGVQYMKMASQVVEQTVNTVISKDHVQDSSLSTSYEAAMEALSSLITRQNRGEKSLMGGKYKKLERMSMYLKILGLDEHIAELKIIHVAGTKGKGSTCSFSEAILRECGFRTGLFTSPHLIDVRERFRLNGLDISEDKFLHYFWDCWSNLKANVTEELPMPPLFQFLTVMAFKIFISEQVDVAIIEVGLGGKRDSTNVIKEPAVCGITSLGMDHVEVLGNTLGEIASHKAGIFKPQIPAFTVPQPSEAMNVLQDTARDLMAPLEVAAPLDYRQLEGLELSLSGDHQLTNAGLAVSLCKCWLQRTGNWAKLFNSDTQVDKLPEAFLRGLSTARLSGRAQIVYASPSKSISSEVIESTSGDLIFYLDGAHSPESMEACAKWFSNAVKANKQPSPAASSSMFKAEILQEVWGNGYVQHENMDSEKFNKISKQVLLFNCMEIRDPQILLPQLASTCASAGTHFSKAIFVPSLSTYNKVTSGASVIDSVISSKDLSWQFKLQRLWENIIHGTDPVLDNNFKMDSSMTLPPPQFLYEDTPKCSSADDCRSCTAVIPSLPLTIKWLRDCVKENPSLRVQVLVTGSLHLVGDVLKLLRR